MLVYVISSSLAGLGGLLFVLDVNSAQPVDFGNFYRAVRDCRGRARGCSLRGGEEPFSSHRGAALMQVLRNMIAGHHPQ